MLQQTPINTINSFKDKALKWLFGACVALIVFVFTSINNKLDKIDAKFELLLTQINTNTIDIEVLKNKIQNLEKKHAINYPIIDTYSLTLFKPEEEIKYKFKPTDNETN